MDGATSHKEKTEIILKLLDFFFLNFKDGLATQPKTSLGLTAQGGLKHVCHNAQNCVSF